MADSFELPVWYENEEKLFPAELQPWGYTHKIKVLIGGIEFFFEPDDEKNYRAMVNDADRDKASKIDKQLLQAVAETLTELFSK
ncbi:MAG: hypothetical protein JWQ78_64 [Sediminibacterium sp.]|nr:hypothetical protein [Sediminibacterium sp.]